MQVKPPPATPPRSMEDDPLALARWYVKVFPDSDNDIGKISRALLAASETAPTADALDAARWRKFNKVAERQWNGDKGYIKFYLPRHLGGFKPLEKTLDEDYEPVAVSATVTPALSELCTAHEQSPRR